MNTNDFLFGFLIAIPIYTFMLFIFRDLLLAHFVQHAILQKVPKDIPMNDLEIPKFDEQVIQEDTMQDILMSYRLMLVLRDELLFLQEKIEVTKDGKTMDIFGAKIKEVQEAITISEQFFRDRKETRYLDIQEEVAEHSKVMYNEE